MISVGKKDEIGKKENLASNTGEGSLKSAAVTASPRRVTDRFDIISFIPKTKLNFNTKEI
ncbi:hypothetical protein GCM10022218_09730 [Sphingobacterium ginsenosidimutans]|uniref:Uncharacterized protein n=1 Tax=Sphingobacterium ginsenosidimutans TaxID=687845 RepID=A0ABP7ZUP4_9SPHI